MPLPSSVSISLPHLEVTDIRLEGSSYDTPNAGRVQAYDSEKRKWRDVCHNGNDRNDKDWSITEAMVACRQLGYPGTAMSRKGGYGNGGNKGIDDIDCVGGK